MNVTEVMQWLEVHGLITLIVALVAAGATAIVGQVGFRWLQRLAREAVPLRILLARARRPVIAGAALIALQFAFGGAPADLAWRSTAAHITALLLIATLTWLVVSAVDAAREVIVTLHPSNVSDNLDARRIQTQTRVLARIVTFFVVLLGAGAALMTFPGVRQVGTSLLASAGVAALVAGVAARPMLGNLIAGLQIALTQPIRIDDVVIIEGEWGRIEEILSSYVVIRLWDQRRLVVPLQWVIENPFQNWTRRESELLGSVLLWVDYAVPLAPLREELTRICEAAPEWDRRVAILQVVETSERAMQLRALVSSADASKSWDLRCRVREGLIGFLQRHHRAGLPRLRAEIESLARAPEQPHPHGTARSELATRPLQPSAG